MEYGSDKSTLTCVVSKNHELYVDGVFQNNLLGTDRAMNTSNDTQKVDIGAPLANHTYANGLIDEIAIFSSQINKGLVS